MKVVTTAAALALLAACGIKGDPEPVPVKTGVTITGTAGIGLTYRKEN